MFVAQIEERLETGKCKITVQTDWPEGNSTRTKIEVQYIPYDSANQDELSGIPMNIEVMGGWEREDLAKVFKMLAITLAHAGRYHVFPKLDL